MRETLDRNFPDQSHSPTCTCQSFSKSSRNTLVKWIHFLRHERVIAREQQVARGRKHRTSHGPHEELSCNRAEQRWRIREDLQRIAFQRFRQAEVENLHIPVSGNLHIRRLEITMHDTLLVRSLKGFANALRNFQCVLKRIAPRAMRPASVLPSTSSSTR